MDSVLYTIEDKCSGCNKCIYNCPVEDANTAYFIGGDSLSNKVHVNPDKCIMCGRCLDTCDHNARDYRDDTQRFIADLARGGRISVLAAPALKMNFPNYKKVLGYLKSLGVREVIDVSFGADIATWAYLKTIAKGDMDSVIAQPCASVVYYIQRLRHDLLPNLAPVQSPMMCAAVYVRKYLRNADRLCFLSPCISKTAEIADANTFGYVSYNVTFKKLVEHIAAASVDLDAVAEADFALPALGLGEIYSSPGGLKENVRQYNPGAWVKQVEGTSLVYEYLGEYADRKQAGKSLPLLLDVLNCPHGCNIGSGTCKNVDVTAIEEAAWGLQQGKCADAAALAKMLDDFDAKLTLGDFTRAYTAEKVPALKEPSEKEYDAIFSGMYKTSKESRERNCFACGYRSCRHMARAIFNGLNHKENCIDYNLHLSQDKVHALQEKNGEITDLMEEVVAKSNELETANVKLMEMDEIKSNFISTVSHELRTPLTSVLGFAKIIRKKLEDDIFPQVAIGDKKVDRSVRQVMTNMDIIVAEGERLTHLINDVLDLAKMEAGKTEWGREKLNITEIIDRATAATSSLFEQKGLALYKEIAPDLPEITGDRDRLIQVMINLISNAIKFTDQGSITCRARLEDNEIVVSVTDTGVGIEAANFDKVFERFKQVGNVLTDKPKGTGLGLPICRHIIEHHGGRIWVESTLGKGSTFAFTLPPADRASKIGVVDDIMFQQLKDRVETVAPLGSGQKKILVVDDERSIRELLRQEFEEAGYLIAEAADGMDAIEMIKKEKPDLIILDVMMPKMNGFDAAAVIKNDPATRDIPIIILSIVEDKKRGLQIGVDRYLTKPTNMDELHKEVEALLAHGGSKKKVLIVNEDEPTVKALTSLLETKEFVVVEAYNYQEALEKVRDEQPDIIIVDTMFSEESQVAAALSFHKNSEKVFIIVNSSKEG